MLLDGRYAGRPSASRGLERGGRCGRRCGRLGVGRIRAAGWDRGRGRARMQVEIDAQPRRPSSPTPLAALTNRLPASRSDVSCKCAFRPHAGGESFPLRAVATCAGPPVEARRGSRPDWRITASSMCNHRSPCWSGCWLRGSVATIAVRRTGHSTRSLGDCPRTGISFGGRCQRGSGVDFATMPVRAAGRRAGEIDSRPLSRRASSRRGRFLDVLPRLRRIVDPVRSHREILSQRGGDRPARRERREQQHPAYAPVRHRCCRIRSLGGYGRPRPIM